MTTDTATWPVPRARLEPARLAPGRRGSIVVTLDVPDGCHVQAHQPNDPFLIPTTLHVDPPPAGIELGPPRYPLPSQETFAWTPIALAIHAGTIEIEVPVDVAADAQPGTATVSGRLRYQGCTASACLRPVERCFEIDVAVVAPAAVHLSDGESDQAAARPGRARRILTRLTRSCPGDYK